MSRRAVAEAVGQGAQLLLGGLHNRPEDRVALERAADAILSSVFGDAQGGWATCRLCDRARCDDCPVDRHRPC